MPSQEMSRAETDGRASEAYFNEKVDVQTDSQPIGSAPEGIGADV